MLYNKSRISHIKTEHLRKERMKSESVCMLCYNA